MSQNSGGVQLKVLPDVVQIRNLGIERHDFGRRELTRRDDWHFDRGRGWRFEHRPGVWSPYHVWWWTGGRVVMLAAPTVTVVPYPNGRYELRGDGMTVPYYWAWVPAQLYIAPLPPPAG